MNPLASLFCLGCILPVLVPSAVVGQAPQGDPASPQQKVSPMLLPQAVVLPRDKDVVVDGSLAEWPSLPAIVLNDRRQLSGTALNAWNGERDCSAVAFAMWDEDFLYLSAQVRDEWHRALADETIRLSEVPLADSLVVTFDPERNTRSTGPDEGRREDREFWLGDMASRRIVQWDRLRGTARLCAEGTARCVVLHDKEQGITTYEAKLPWHEIVPASTKIANRLVLDFQIVLNDFDESTDPLPQTRIGWTFGCGPVIDPGLLGSIMLVGDRSPLEGRMPEFPPKPAVGKDPLGAAERWHDLTTRLEDSPPAIFDGSVAPELAGGSKRLAVLEEIERHCEAWPRVDFVDFNNRIHRRMIREVAGIRARGLPYWWASRLRDTSEAAEASVEQGAVRIFRIPMGGWLIGTSGGGFAVDPAGADVAEWLWGRMGFAILTQPLESAFRNDQLLLRMLMAKPTRPVMTHIAFHLPFIEMKDMPLVAPGTDCSPPKGMKLFVLGKVLDDGMVVALCSYYVRLVSGLSIFVAAPALQADDILADVTAEPLDVLFLSPHNPERLLLIEKLKPRLIVIDGGFRCRFRPDVERLKLSDLHALQKELLPCPSLLLAPGESWDVKRGE